MFEQSLLLNHDNKRPWNFLASLSAELLVVSLALLIPLLYRDHLPAVHWKDITVGPAPLSPPIPQPAAHAEGHTSTMLSTMPRRVFHLGTTASPSQAPTAAVEFSTEAPPTLGPGLRGGATNAMGTFIPNYVAVPPPPKPPTETPKPPSAPTTVRIRSCSRASVA